MYGVRHRYDVCVVVDADGQHDPACPLANALMRVTQPVLERQRLDFLAEIASGARHHLATAGRLLLVISPLEAAEAPGKVAGLIREDSMPVPSIPGLEVTVFRFVS